MGGWGEFGVRGDPKSSRAYLLTFQQYEARRASYVYRRPVAYLPAVGGLLHVWLDAVLYPLRVRAHERWLDVGHGAQRGHAADQVGAQHLRGGGEGDGVMPQVQVK